nr:DUF309 domain-containing protein [Bacillus sp. FJAT-47783]
MYYFHCERDYFECHEILEEFWKEDPPNERKSYWVGFIQIAVGLYHHRRNNFVGAERMFQRALNILQKNERYVTSLGINYDELLSLLSVCLDDIRHGKQYESIHLPIYDQNLLKKCETYAKQRGKTWGAPSDLNNQFLLHKHSLRDRTDVVKERQRKLDQKKRSRD